MPTISPSLPSMVVIGKLGKKKMYVLLCPLKTIGCRKKTYKGGEIKAWGRRQHDFNGTCFRRACTYPFHCLKLHLRLGSSWMPLTIALPESIERMPSWSIATCGLLQKLVVAKKVTHPVPGIEKFAAI
jgi:hypothetical protein